MKAVIVQNVLHQKNSQRLEAVTQGSFIDFSNDETAKKFLDQCLLDALTKLYRQQELAAMKHYQEESQNIIAQKVLMAPDIFYAAVLMKEEKMFLG